MDLDLLDLDMFQRGEQDEVFARLRREAPVCWQDHPHGRGFWSVVQHGDVVTVNRDAMLFSSELGSISLLGPDERANGLGADTRGTMMIASDPPRHTRYRRLVNSGFTPRTMKAIERSLAGRATRIIDLVIEKGSCDFVTDVAAELPLQAIAEIMGVPQEDRGRLFDWSNRMVGLDDPEYATTDGTVASAELLSLIHISLPTPSTPPSSASTRPPRATATSTRAWPRSSCSTPIIFWRPEEECRPRPARVPDAPVPGLRHPEATCPGTGAILRSRRAGLTAQPD